MSIILFCVRRSGQPSRKWMRVCKPFCFGGIQNLTRHPVPLSHCLVHLFTTLPSPLPSSDCCGRTCRLLLWVFLCRELALLPDRPLYI